VIGAANADEPPRRELRLVPNVRANGGPIGPRGRSGQEQLLATEPVLRSN